MEQLKKLRRRSLASLSFLILLLFVIGSFGVYASNLCASEPEAWYLYDVPADQLEGTYVTVDLNWI